MKKLRKVHATHIVHASNHVNDAWGVEWDCNTDALDLDDAYRRNGKKLSFLAGRINDDDNKYSNNTCRAACYLVWKNHYRECTPEVATKVISFLKYLVYDNKWLSEMRALGDIKSVLSEEMKKAKLLARDAGTLDEVLDDYNRTHVHAHAHAHLDLEALAKELSGIGAVVKIVR